MDYMDWSAEDLIEEFSLKIDQWGIVYFGPRPALPSELQILKKNKGFIQRVEAIVRNAERLLA